MNKGTILTLATIAVVLVLVGVFTLSKQNNASDGTPTSPAAQALSSTAEISYTDLKGNPIAFNQYEGKVRIVNSWASWCPFCVQEMADFEILAEEYKDAEVVVIAINRKESNVQALNFINQLGGLDNIVFVQDLRDRFYQSIGGFSMPETVFYDKNGNISTHKRGFMSLEEMRTLTKKAIDATSAE